MMPVDLARLWRRYMPNALLTGGSSGFGVELREELERNNYNVEVIPRFVLPALEPGYNARLKEYDLVFFNHHYMPEEFDHKSYEMNCLVPLHILKSITLLPNAKVGWMVSKGIGAHFMPQYSPYFAFKSVNVHIMRYLAHKENDIYFGVEPGHLVKQNWKTTASCIVKMLDSVESGNVYNLNGSVSGL